MLDSQSESGLGPSPDVIAPRMYALHLSQRQMCTGAADHVSNSIDRDATQTMASIKTAIIGGVRGAASDTRPHNRGSL